MSIFLRWDGLQPGIPLQTVWQICATSLTLFILIHFVEGSWPLAGFYTLVPQLHFQWLQVPSQAALVLENGHDISQRANGPTGQWETGQRAHETAQRAPGITETAHGTTETVQMMLGKGQWFSRQRRTTNSPGNGNESKDQRKEQHWEQAPPAGQQNKRTTRNARGIQDTSSNSITKSWKEDDRDKGPQ